ncbi:hypothetical protein COOONC_03274 [Cooperia oncophora]
MLNGHQTPGVSGHPASPSERSFLFVCQQRNLCIAGALSLPKFASIQPEIEIKEEEIADCDEEKPSTSKEDGIKEEVSDEKSDSGSAGSSVILLENGECDTTKQKTGDENKENGATISSDSSQVSKEESVEEVSFS